MVAIKRVLGIAAALVFTIPALAGQLGSGNDGSRSIQLRESVVLAGTTIVPGSYTLSWSREHGSDDVRIAILRGKKVLASATGRWVESVDPSPYEALVYHTAGGANELAGILFERSADSIRIGGETTRADSGQAVGTQAN